MDDYDYLYKLIICGGGNATAVGTTSFLDRYIDAIFNECPIAGDGHDFRLKMFKMEDGKKIKLQIWLLPGQKRFWNINASFYRGAHGIILIYDITERRSYKMLDSWLIEFKKICSKDINIFLVGNKMDLQEKREVATKEGEEFASKHGLLFSECSAKTGENVEIIVNKLVKTLNENPKMEKKLKKEKKKLQTGGIIEKLKGKNEEKERDEQAIKNLSILLKYISF